MVASAMGGAFARPPHRVKSIIFGLPINTSKIRYIYASICLRYPPRVVTRQVPARLFDNVTRLRQRLSTEMDGSLAVLLELELSLSQALSLLMLAERGPMSISALQAGVGRSQAATSHLVEQLEKRGLVTRETDPEDRRRRVVQIAPEGRRAVGRVEEVRHAAIETVLGKVPRAVLARFDQALQDVLDALEG